MHVMCVCVCVRACVCVYISCEIRDLTKNFTMRDNLCGEICVDEAPLCLLLLLLVYCILEVNYHMHMEWLIMCTWRYVSCNGHVYMERYSNGHV